MIKHLFPGKMPFTVARDDLVIVKPISASLTKSSPVLYLTNEDMPCVVLFSPFISPFREKTLQINLSRHLRSTGRPNLLAA